MNKFATLRSILIAAVSMTASISSFGAVIPRTNAVQFINVQLTLLTQGPSKTNSPAKNEITATVQRTIITTKDLISWLGAATTNNFSPKSRLVRVTHFNATTNNTAIEIREGTNAPVDVSGFFDTSDKAAEVHRTTFNTVTKLTTGTVFEFRHFALTNLPPHKLVPNFSLYGAETRNFVTLRSGTTVLTADEITASLAGIGAGTNGVVGLITGSLTINGTVKEVK